MNNSFLLSKPVTINSRKYDGILSRSWQAYLIDQKGSQLTFFGVFDSEVKHTELGVIRSGTVSYEFYWLERYYNVFRFHEPNGAFRNFYCNINLPPVFENQELNYVDLDLDVIVDGNLNYKILDEDEFNYNAALFNYSDALISKTHKTLEEVLSLIKTRKFPFNSIL